MFKKFSNWWKSLSTVEKVLVVIAGYFVFQFLKKYFKRIKAAAQASAVNATQTQTASAYGVDSTRIPILNGYANDLQVAIYDWEELFLFGWTPNLTEDEDTVYDRINKCKSAGEAKYLAKQYVESYPSGLPAAKQISLYESIKRNFSAAEISNINSQYWAAIHSMA